MRAFFSDNWGGFYVLNYQGVSVYHYLRFERVGLIPFFNGQLQTYTTHNSVGRERDIGLYFDLLPVTCNNIRVNNGCV